MSKIIPIKENFLFSKVYAKGKKSSEKNVVVYILRNYRSKDTCLGITTGKKIGGAVLRSRARRLIREAYRNLADGHNFRYPCLVVIVARTAITDPHRKMGEVLSDLHHAFSKLGIYADEMS